MYQLVSRILSINSIDGFIVYIYKEPEFYGLFESICTWLAFDPIYTTLQQTGSPSGCSHEVTGRRKGLPSLSHSVLTTRLDRRR